MGQQVTGLVQGGGGHITNSTVTLWAAGQGTPRKLAETRTRDDGALEFRGVPKMADDEMLYLRAQGQRRHRPDGRTGHEADR
jgi:hypothetical protein